MTVERKNATQPQEGALCISLEEYAADGVDRGRLAVKGSESAVDRDRSADGRDELMVVTN